MKQCISPQLHDPNMGETVVSGCVYLRNISVLCGKIVRGGIKMGKKYANPPIIEAVCEFRLPPDSQWDLTIPGLIYEEIKNEFPNKEQRLVQEIGIIQSPQGVQQQMRTTERMFFLSDDRRSFIQVGPRLLAVNRLKPYPHWERFKPQIERAFQALNGTINVETFQRIGLRYINRIELPGQLIDLEAYFDFRPFLGQALQQNPVGAFMIGCVFPFSDGKNACKVELTNASNSSAFTLDLDYFLAQPQTISVNQTLGWVENAHQHIEEIFEGCITQKLRDVFEEVK